MKNIMHYIAAFTASVTLLSSGVAAIDAKSAAGYAHSDVKTGVTYHQSTFASVGTTAASIDTVSLNAQHFVQSAKLYKGLSLLLLKQIKTTDVVQNAIDAHGFEAVKNAVVRQIQEASSRYRKDWEDQLVRLYAAHLDAPVLASLASEREASPYFADLVALQQKIGLSEQLTSSTTFTAAKSFVLKNIKRQF